MLVRSVIVLLFWAISLATNPSESVKVETFANRNLIIFSGVVVSVEVLRIAVILSKSIRSKSGSINRSEDQQQ